MEVKEEQVSSDKKDSKIQHISNSAQQQTEEEGSDNGDFDNSKDTFVVNLFEHSNDGKDSAHGSEVKEFDSEYEKLSLIISQKYTERTTFLIIPTKKQ